MLQMNEALRTEGAMRWTAVAAVVGSGIVSSLQIGKAMIAVPMLQADLGLDFGQLGWVTGIFALLGLFGGIPAGAVVAAVGDRRMLLLGLAALAVGAAAGACATTFAVLLGARLIEGFGFLLITVAGPSILQRIADPARRDIVFALWSCFMATGMSIAMVAGPMLGGWRVIWASGAVLAVLAMVAAAMVIPVAMRTVAPSWRRLPGDVLTILRTPGPVLLAVCFALYALMFFALFSFLPVLLMQRMQVGYGTAGLLSALATAVNIVGNLTAGVLLSRGVPRAALIVTACGIMGVSALGIFLPVLPDTAAFLLCVLFSMIGGAIPATLLSTAPLLAPAAALVPVSVGLLMQGSNLGQAAGPVAVGGLIGSHGWPAAALLVATAAVLAVITALWLGGLFRRRGVAGRAM
ncbi:MULTISPECIES: MFS transporter [unclassified Bradyrhizobium]|uniref:MFS transporter n=1 Tax=unclassified Bradyrhizobium TaxID=2631580 RepID=UPI0020115392|nr:MULTISPECIES: MFS transporter [unclassified Bradyrhizobium]